jgi:hypothetical protein
MASFTIYDPKTKAFRALDTADSVDLPFEQVLLINILLELRVHTEYLSVAQEVSGDYIPDDPDELRTAMVQEIGS